MLERPARPDQAPAVRRVALMGASGSGKTTFGRRLSARFGLPFVELDSIYHQPGWTPLETEEFQRRVKAVVVKDAWIVDGNYADVRPLVWARADTVFCFDIGRFTVLRRVVARTLRRAYTRQELWNGNKEPVSNLYRWNPEKNIVRWSWVKYPTYSERYRAAVENPEFSHIRFIRFGSPADVDSWWEQET
jgi:adenylate kinase family enzyme